MEICKIHVERLKNFELRYKKKSLTWGYINGKRFGFMNGNIVSLQANIDDKELEFIKSIHS